MRKAAFGMIEGGWAGRGYTSRMTDLRIRTGRETFFIDAQGIIRDVCTDAILFM